jgi:hypothetical protein
MTSQQSIRPQSQTTTPKRASKMASGQSLNHLLNFTLPPRQSQPPQSLPRRSRKHGTHQGVWNKERECCTDTFMAYLFSNQLLLEGYLSTCLCLCRLCQCTVPVHDEPYRRLYRPLCGPGHFLPMAGHIASHHTKVICISICRCQW